MGFAIDEFPFTSEYESDLRAVLNYIREVKKMVGEYDEVIAELRVELENIQGIYPRVDALERAVAGLPEIRDRLSTLESGVSDIARDLRDLADKEQSDFNGVQVAFDKIRLQITELNILLKKEIKTLLGIISDLEVRIEKELDYIRWRLDQIDTSVLNPWHMELGRIDQDRNVKFIYTDLADGCLTAEEYCRLGFDANGYNVFDLTAYEYAVRGKKHLHLCWVYSPAYGFRQEISNVLTSIINYFDDTFTANQYTAEELTAEEYSVIGIDAQEYYRWRGDKGKRVVYRPDGTGLTKRIYQKLAIADDGHVVVKANGHGITRATYGKLSLDSNNELIVDMASSGITREVYEHLEVVET